MTATKKLFTDYTEVTTNVFTDQVPVLQSGNKKTTLQKIYNLFKLSFDNVYTTASAVSTQITSALSTYATQTFATNAATTALSNANTYTNEQVALRQLKQSTSTVDINASGVDELGVYNCILSITNIPGSSGNKEIKMRLDANVFDGNEIMLCNVIYKGFDVNLRSWAIYFDAGSLFLSLFINVHSRPTEPVLIAINKIN